MTKQEKKSLKLEFLLLCDYAYTAEGGKLSLVGKFETIFANEFPTFHPEMFLVANFTGEENSEYDLTLKITAPSGEELIPMNMPSLKLKLSPTGSGNIIHRFLNLPIKNRGEYLVSLNEGERKLASIKLLIMQKNPNKESSMPN